MVPGAGSWQVLVRGTVQGVGFRPFVHRLASELALDGLVGNDSLGVFVEVEGPSAALDEFRRPSQKASSVPLRVAVRAGMRYV